MSLSFKLIHCLFLYWPGVGECCRGVLLPRARNALSAEPHFHSQISLKKKKKSNRILHHLSDTCQWLAPALASQPAEAEGMLPCGHSATCSFLQHHWGSVWGGSTKPVPASATHRAALVCSCLKIRLGYVPCWGSML